jgi:hypothetical protein
LKVISSGSLFALTLRSCFGDVKKDQACDHRFSQYQPIENYRLIGYLHMAALVGTDGSIDWLYVPRFDSPSVNG